MLDTHATASRTIQTYRGPVTLTDRQFKAFKQGKELIVVLGKAYVRGVDKWPKNLLEQRG